MWASLRRRLGRSTSTGSLPPRLSNAQSDRGNVADLAAIFAVSPSPEVGSVPDHHNRKRKQRPTLVEAGENAGASRVQYTGHNIPIHLLTKDFFISVVQIDTFWLALLVGAVYLGIFFFWSIWWWLVVKYHPGCLYGAETYTETLAFSVVTQMTIGYGNTGPQACWLANWIIILQSITGLLLEAITLGVVFARISHPHQRSRSIFMSNKAVVARRDGILKFMFRVADIRNTQVVEPNVKAYLYTWGEGRITAEGERIPVRVEPLYVDYIDGMLLLPLIIEHTIDERSPLCGHTHTSLLALNAEIVVTFEGTTEMGNPFMARRSYIPDELYWGHEFQNIVKLPAPGSGRTEYMVQLDAFHEVAPQKDMPKLLPSQLSQLVVNRAKRTVPYPLLGENTLVLSDVLCVAPNAKGELCLHCRAGDTYPNQMLEIIVRVYLYRWRDPQKRGAAGDGEAFEQFNLDVGYEDGSDRLYLRLPSLVTHVISDASPLAAWREPGGLEADANSEIVVVINSYMNTNNEIRLRQRTYAVDHHVRYGCEFKPMVKHPALARDRKPRVRWQMFHDVQAAAGMGAFPPAPAHGRNAPGGAPGATVLSVAPESHANMRSMVSMLRRETSGGVLAPAPRNSSYADFERNDFTVLPMDLQRYAATVGDASGIHSSMRLSAEAALGSGSLEGIQEEGPGTSRIAALLPDVLRFAADTTEASDSLPHAAALHPTLPGPDRFRLSDMTDPGAVMNRDDYTVPSMDLSRYAAQMTADSFPRGRVSTFTPLPADFRESMAATETLEEQRSGEAAPAAPAPQPEPVAEEAEASGAAAAALAGVQPIGRTTSVGTGLGTEYDMDEESAGPMHFAHKETWQQGRALRNLKSLFSKSDSSAATTQPTPRANSPEEQA